MPTVQVDQVSVDASGLARFARDLRRADKDMQKLLLKQIRAKVGAAMLPAAQSAASWSSRIPASIRVSATAKAVSIRAGGAGAPHAAAFEHGGEAGSFRHPVFGHRDVWVEQDARPFVTPSVKANEEALLDSLMLAFDAWATEMGAK